MVTPENENNNYLRDLTEPSPGERPTINRPSFFSTPLGVVLIVLSNFVALGLVGLVLLNRWEGLPGLNLGNVKIAGRDLREIQQEAAESFRNFDKLVPVQERLEPELREQYDSISKLLQSVEKSARDEDDRAFQELVDFEGLYQRIAATGAFDGWSRLSQLQARMDLQNGVSVESWWQQLVIADIVKDVSSDGDIIVYAYGMEQEETLLDAVKMRFTLTRQRNSWKLADWNSLEFGLSESAEWAAQSGDLNDPEILGDERWNDLIVQADESIEAGKEDDARQLIRRAERQPGTAAFHDYRWLLTGYRWQALGETQDAKRCFLKVRDADQMPSTYEGLADCEPRYASRQAIEYLTKLQDLIGPSGRVCQNLATMHESLGDSSAALACWKQLLRFDPENATALAAILQSLSVQKKSEIVSYLERVDDPEGIIVQLADNIRDSDHEGFEFLLEHLQQEVPDSPNTTSLLAMAAELRGDYQEAQGKYRHAFQHEKDTQRQQDLVHRYLEAAAEAGNLVEAWDEVPDPQTAFETLAYDYEEGVETFSQDEFEQIVGKIYKRHPSDLRVLYHVAQQALEREHYKEVVKLLKQPLGGFTINPGVEEADEYDEKYESKKLLLRQLATALHQTLPLEKAYQKLRESLAPLSMIASPLIKERKWAEVDQLIKLHRSNEPADIEIQKVLAAKAYTLQQWDSACNYFRKVLATEGQDAWWLKYQYRECCVNAGRWREYYDAEATGNDSRAKVFRHLASQLRRGKRWDDYQELVRLFQRQSSPFAPSNLYEEALYHWERHDYQRCAATCNQLLRKVDHGDVFAEDTLDEYDLSEIRDYYFRSLLKVNSYERAAEFAKKLKQEHDDQVSVALVEAVQGNHHDALQLALDAVALPGQTNANRFYNDEDHGEIFLSSPYRQLHEKSPISIPYDVMESVAVFFFEKRPELTSEQLKELIGASSELNDARLNQFGQVRGFPLPTLGDFAVESFWMQQVGGAEIELHYCLFDNSTFWLTAGEFPLSKNWAWPKEEELPTEGLRWLVIGQAGWTNAQREHSSLMLRCVAAELARESAKYFATLSSWSDTPNEFYRVTPELLNAWQQGESLAPFSDLRVLLEYKDPEDIVVDQRQFRHDLHDAIRTWSDHQETDFRLLVRLGGTRFGELAWLKVTEVDRKYGQWQLTGNLLKQVRTIPALHPKLPLSVAQHEVKAFRLSHGDVVAAPQRD